MRRCGWWTDTAGPSGYAHQSCLNAWALASERGPAGRVVDEFEARAIVTNNSATSVGSAGAPIAALAPDIGN